MESSPPPSGEVFFSSPSHDFQNSGPADEVLLLVAKAQLTRRLPAPITTFLNQPAQKILFSQIFTRQIELLKSRSQAFEDCHVTVYDKTLLTLTRNGNDLENPTAIVYFCEEYLGIHNYGSPVASRRVLQQSVTLPALLSQGKLVKEWMILY
jgi:hypothetical protein